MSKLRSTSTSQKGDDPDPTRQQLPRVRRRGRLCDVLVLVLCFASKYRGGGCALRNTGWWFGTWILWLSISWEVHHPNWRTHIFRGVETTNQNSWWTDGDSPIILLYFFVGFWAIPICLRRPKTPTKAHGIFAQKTRHGYMIRHKVECPKLMFVSLVSPCFTPLIIWVVSIVNHIYWSSVHQLRYHKSTINPYIYI